MQNEFKKEDNKIIKLKNIMFFISKSLQNLNPYFFYKDAIISFD